MCFLCALSVSETQTPILKISLGLHPYTPPSNSCIACFRDIFECNCATFMCFKNIIDPNPYFENLRRLHLREPLSNSNITCSTNIIESKCATFMCFLCALRIYKTRVPITTIREILALEVYCRSGHQLLFEISLSAIGLHLCAFRVFQEIQDPNRCFQNFPRSHPPQRLPSGWSIFYLCDIFECNCATFIFFLCHFFSGFCCIAKYRNSNRITLLVGNVRSIHTTLALVPSFCFSVYTPPNYKPYFFVWLTSDYNKQLHKLAIA